MSQPNLNVLYLKKKNGQCLCVYITLQVVKLNYGMKDKNPIDQVRFYRKDNPDKATKIKKTEVGDNVIPTKLFTT